ncbi:FKBP-type peptidyl-prolyl cis-trans isomerase [Streptosporangium sp. DT93]|uniref:FKBP-type peptidyl-prolyl cis-trans isomerase n=1 Tax=Streptosporangium sp. DT93 TaxID=3393428 RepID=UPI003CF40B04
MRPTVRAVVRAVVRATVRPAHRPASRPARPPAPRPGTLLAALLAAFSLVPVAACSSGDGPAGPDVEVVGNFGERPTVRFPEGTPSPGLRFTELMTGTGARIGADDLVVAQYTAHVWDGKDNRLLASSFNQGAPASFPLNGTLTGVGKALRGHAVGSRVIASVPPEEGYGPNPPGGMTARDELFYVVDVLGTFPPGTAAGGEPTGVGGAAALDGVRVTGPPGGRPALSVPKAAPPATLRSRILLRGTGAGVRAGHLVVTQYEGRVWRGGAVFDSTWAAGRPRAFQIGRGRVIAGWDRALVGVPVGSRVALVVPPGLGYEEGLPPSIRPGDTLVFVVDVLAAY